jgi:hypothetical protein
MVKIVGYLMQTVRFSIVNQTILSPQTQVQSRHCNSIEVLIYYYIFHSEVSQSAIKVLYEWPLLPIVKILS